jgi:hypothetical protein
MFCHYTYIYLLVGRIAEPFVRFDVGSTVVSVRKEEETQNI